MDWERKKGEALMATEKCWEDYFLQMMRRPEKKIALTNYNQSDSKYFINSAMNRFHFASLRMKERIEGFSLRSQFRHNID
jgi:hypothetical protein